MEHFDWTSYLRFVFALSFVIGLIFLVSWLLRRFGPGTVRPVRGRKRRLEILESLALDGRRRILLVRCDKTDHLLLLGPSNDLVIEGNLPVETEDSDDGGDADPSHDLEMGALSPSMTRPDQDGKTVEEGRA